MRRTQTRLASWSCLIVLATGCNKSEPSATDAQGSAAAQGPTREQAEASGKNVGKLAMATLNYESPHKAYPLRSLKTKDGKPGLSWRVALLPFLGEEALYEQFKLDEPWDSPNNKPLVAKMPSVYKSPVSKAGAGFTNYLAVATPQSVLAEDQPVMIKHITDGTSQTALLLEVNDDRAVPWTKPADFTPDSAQPLTGLGGLHPKGAFIVGTASGDVYLVKSSMDPKTFTAMCTRNGDEIIGWDAVRVQADAPAQSAIPPERK